MDKLSQLLLALFFVTFASCNDKELIVEPDLSNPSTEFESCDLSCLEEVIPSAFSHLPELRFRSAGGNVLIFKGVVEDNAWPISCNGNDYVGRFIRYTVEDGSDIAFDINAYLGFINGDCNMPNSVAVYNFLPPGYGLHITLQKYNFHGTPEVEGDIIINGANPNGFEDNYHEQLSLNGITFDYVHEVVAPRDQFKAFYVTPELGIVAFYDRTNTLYVIE